MSGRVADEPDTVLAGLAQGMRDPVALVADDGRSQIAGQSFGRLAHVEARIERTHADAQLVPRGEAPPVARRNVGAVDPDLHIAPGAVWMDLEPAGEQGVRRLDGGAGAEHAAPAERVHYV